MKGMSLIMRATRSVCEHYLRWLSRTNCSEGDKTVYLSMRMGVEGAHWCIMHSGCLFLLLSTSSSIRVLYILVKLVRTPSSLCHSLSYFLTLEAHLQLVVKLGPALLSLKHQHLQRPLARLVSLSSPRQQRPYRC